MTVTAGGGAGASEGAASTQPGAVRGEDAQGADCVVGQVLCGPGRAEQD